MPDTSVEVVLEAAPDAAPDPVQTAPEDLMAHVRALVKGGGPAPATKSPAAQTDDDVDDVDDDVSPKPAKGGVQARIDQLTREKNDAIRALEAEKGRSRTPAAAPPPAPVQFDRPKPQFGEFDDVGKFYEADAEWRAEKAQFDGAARAQQAELQTRVAKMASDWDSRAAELRKEIPGFDSVVNTETVESLNASPSALKYAFKLPDGPRVVYAIMSDPELSRQFAEMDAEDQVAQLATMRATVASATARLTSAPNPPKALPKAAPKPQSRYRDDMPQLEFAKALRADLKRRGSR